jgi:hypothetical protein
MQDKIQRLAIDAGQQLQAVLNPLLVSWSESDPQKLHKMCSTISLLATKLNAQLKARYIKTSTFWPVLGQNFDKSEMVYVGEIYDDTISRVVRLPLCFGIKAERSGSVPTVLVKSQVEVALAPPIGII